MKKIQQMNDKYNYERMSQQALEREFNSYNQKEAMQKRMEKEKEKKQRYNDYMTNLQQYQSQCDLQKKIEREKKEKRRQELENDLYSYYQRKDKERLDKLQEEKMNQQLFEQQNDYRNNMYNQYRNKIDSMNHRIYSNAMRYNNFVNGGANDDLFKSSNDYDYNRKIAEMKEKERHDRLYNSAEYLRLREQEKKENQKYNEILKQQKLNSQMNYKTYLDQQNEQKKISKEENKKRTLTESAQQLLMPSYNYPNLPQPYKNKAFDPINYYTKTPSSPSYMTERPSYLGESRLRHNPITCPVDDIEYNKYVNYDRNKYLNFDNVNTSAISNKY